MASQKLLSLLLLYVALCATALRVDYGKLGFRADLATTTVSSHSPQFTVPSEADNGANLIPNVNDPEAVNAQSVCPGYTASNVQNTTHGFTADLDLAGSACNVYGNDISSLTLIVEYQAKDRLHVEILPRYIGAQNESWFVLPEALVPRPAVDDGSSCDAGSSDLQFEWSNDPSFYFTVTRKCTGDVLFTTKGSKLVYEDQFFEFVAPLPENYNLYGLGEVIHGFRLGNNLTRTLFAADAGDPIDGNIYGSHPIYLDTRYFDCSGNYVANATDTSAKYTSHTHSVFLRNAHAQEIVLKESGITWRGLGGTIDLYFYAGPSVESILTSYQKSAIGLPTMQQYFAFGYHQCRWGYTGWDDLQEIVDSFAAFQIPLETIWSDIDYMNQYRDFENDANSWGYDKAAKFLDGLHANGQHYVPIVDSAIYVPNPSNASDAYPIYDRGVQANAFMLNPDGSLYIGDVWPGYTVFPDWIGAVLNGSQTFEWWANELTTWHKNVAYSGIWIDMSEVSSFCVGSCGTGNLTLNPVHPPFKLPGEPGAEIFQYPEGFNLTNATDAAAVSSLSSSLAAATATPTSSAASSTAAASSTSTSYLRTTPTPGSRNVNYPPYVINNVQGDLAVHAVSPNATHHGGTQEYDFHNLFGHQILNATYHGLLDVFPGKRPFIIGRSTFAGSGKWAGHWGGDNAALWSYMYFSIPQALTFSVFGIPMFGVDTCGFNGNTDMELCARWMQLSAFFPFYRNHNVLSAIPQEPFRWSAVADATKTVMAIRYSLLPYMYTAFWKASTEGQTVMRALAWEFPSEPWLANADRQFLLGDAVMVTPCLVQGADSVDGVFPGVGDGTMWYDWYTHSPVKGVSAGQNVTIAAPLGHIPVYLRGGYVIPTQEPSMTTKASRQNPWGLIVALDSAGKAKGELYVDDGESLTPSETLNVQFSVTQATLSASVSGKYADANPLGNVTVLGVSSSVSAVKLNGAAVDAGSWTYNATSQALMANLQALTKSGAWSGNWELSWA